MFVDLSLSLTLILCSFRLVVVNLSRQSADFNFEKKDESETGILEIVGFHPDSLRVIEGFAKNSFV